MPNSNCEVIYFKPNEIIKQEHLIKEVGIKKNSQVLKQFVTVLIGQKRKISDEISKFGKTNAIEDISGKMNSIGCDCEHQNPSGKCYLKDVKKAIVVIIKGVSWWKFN